MFRSNKAFSGFSVNDTQKAKQFYSEILGLQVSSGEMDSLLIHLAGGTEIMAYPKGDQHVAATFTILNFIVNDIDKAVEELMAKGVKFEHYDDNGLQTDEKGVFRGADKGQGPNIAWFKDPAGNILSIIEDQDS